MDCSTLIMSQNEEESTVEGDGFYAILCGLWPNDLGIHEKSRNRNWLKILFRNPHSIRMILTPNGEQFQI